MLANILICIGSKVGAKFLSYLGVVWKLCYQLHSTNKPTNL